MIKFPVSIRNRFCSTEEAAAGHRPGGPRIALALLLLVAACSARGGPGTGTATEGGPSSTAAFSLLSYNVHGLFGLIARDDPRDRSPTIGWLANRYDVVLFQEDFDYHDVLRRQMVGKADVRGNGMGYDPRRVAVKALLFPIAVFLPHFSPPYGAGVSAVVRDDLLLPGGVRREAYGICHGWFGDNGDCWANKGFLRVRIGYPDTWQVDVYTTHLESGPSLESVATRRRQLQILARAIAADSAGRAVIVAGDFNIAFARPGDRESIMAFRSAADLRDSGAGPEYPSWRERDFILYRDAADLDLSVQSAGEATEFVNQNRALSDHPALYARFQVQPR